MTEKIKVTQVQKEWLDEILTDENADYAINIQPLRKRPDSPVVEWPASKLAKAFYIGYEVEETFKVGDWVINIANGRVAQIDNRGICGDDVWVNDDDFNFFCASQTRHATPEEIKAGKERRVWKSIGRKVGEFRSGDWAEHKNGEIIVGMDWMKTCYEAKCLKGFYPAESYISFGGDSE